MIWTLKKCNKKMGSPCSFTRQQALKMGYFYWLCVKNPNHLHTCTEISLGYLKDTKFYLENKASFIHIRSIASFKPLLIARLWEYCTFSVSSVVSLKSSSWPKYTQYGTIYQKKIMFSLPLSSGTGKRRPLGYCVSARHFIGQQQSMRSCTGSW